MFSFQNPLIGMGLPRKLTVPTTLLSILREGIALVTSQGTASVSFPFPSVWGIHSPIAGRLCSEEDSLFKAVYAARAE
ncbi:hypothetical protein P8767_16510 [Peribacillus frigoritolerans]|nr:hypothetical protein [Peribacillus frigoritolerans]